MNEQAETTTAPDVGDLQPRSRPGRPTREQAALRDRRLLEIATALFETRGFEATSMDAIAEAAGVGKPTLYARYQDKAALFTAVIRMRVDALMTPLAEAARRIVEGGDAALPLEELLTRLGRKLLRASLTKESVGMTRIVLAQAVKFPELARLSQEEGWLRTVSIVGSLLRVYGVEEPDAVADMFLNMVLGREQRSLMLGYAPVDEAGIERRVERAVRILLTGMLRR